MRVVRNGEYITIKHGYTERVYLPWTFKIIDYSIDDFNGVYIEALEKITGIRCKIYHGRNSRIYYNDKNGNSDSPNIFTPSISIDYPFGYWTEEYHNHGKKIFEIGYCDYLGKYISTINYHSCENCPNTNGDEKCQGYDYKNFFLEDSKYYGEYIDFMRTGRLPSWDVQRLYWISRIQNDGILGLIPPELWEIILQYSRIEPKDEVLIDESQIINGN